LGERLTPENSKKTLDGACFPTLTFRRAVRIFHLSQGREKKRRAGKPPPTAGLHARWFNETKTCNEDVSCQKNLHELPPPTIEKQWVRASGGKKLIIVRGPELEGARYQTDVNSPFTHEEPPAMSVGGKGGIVAAHEKARGGNGHLIETQEQRK